MSEQPVHRAFCGFIAAGCLIMPNTSTNIDMVCNYYDAMCVVTNTENYNSIQNMPNIFPQFDDNIITKGITVDISNSQKNIENLKKIDNISRFEKDWNGYGAPGFSEKVITNARDFINVVPEKPELFPTGRGTIQMEYRLADKTYLEFEIYEEHIAVLYMEAGDADKAEESNLSVHDYNSIIRYINLLNKRKIN